MRKSLAIFFILAFCGNIFAQVKWSQPPTYKPLGLYQKLPISASTNDNPNRQPVLYMTPAGVLAVGANFRVLPNSNEQDEIYLSYNPAWPNVMFGSANTTVGSTYGQGVYVTTNGGLNWYGTDLMPNEPSSTSDPAPAIDKNGTFVFTSLNTAGTAFMYGQYSTNFGVNWSTPYTIYASSSDKNLSASDDVPSSPYYGRTYTVWTIWSGSYPIGVSYTTNGGVSWSTAQAINSPSSTSQGCDVVVGPNPAGVVYVCWSKQVSVSTAVGFAKSTNGGVNWTVNEAAYTTNGIRDNSNFGGWGVRVNDFPRIAVDKSGGPRNGWIYIVDAEKNLAPAGSEADIILHRSTDGGSTWSAGVRVNQDAMNNGKLQFFPVVCVDANGGVNVVYYDNRNYANTGDSCETYMSRSIDGGVTFTDIKVSDHRWRPRGEGGSGTYMGDYIGLAYAAGKLWPFWFDNSTGHMQAWTAPIDVGPAITHTPLGSTELISGTRTVNCSITPSGSGINPSTAQLKYAKNSTTWTTVNLTNSGGTNWNGNITLSGAGTYNYYITATDSLARTVTAPGGAPANYYSFIAATDTVKPIITHTPIGSTAQALWPVSVTATVTDNIGVDSVWVRWYKNTTANYKQFKILNTSGSTYSALFNSLNSDVAAGDVIYYRIIAQDNSSGHNRDSSTLYSFPIIALVNACIGTGSVSSNYPFTTYWMDGRTQMLFTSAEILAAGGSANKWIQRIGFNVITAASQTMSGFSVKFQHTTATSLTGFVTSGWTTAFSGTYAVPGTGWQYIDLQAPYFAYNGTSNLLVEICYDNTAYTSYSPVNATTIAGMTWGYYTDNSTGCTMTGGAAQTSRPNVCLTFIPVNGTGNIGLSTPTEYSLNQNYPNPFNPVTKINFEIPKQGLVSLKIYDVLGREVKTLVNEVKTPGVYSVDFNGSELSSGVYFYKMETGGFSDIKRMMLIK